MNDYASNAHSPGRSAPYRNMGHWRRVLFTLIGLFLYAVSRFVVIALTVFQLLWTLVVGYPNERLIPWGRSLARYSCELVEYLTFVTETRPFPFDRSWPSGDA
ncbi:MAG: DUF4389 domain-containing protein [Pseudomonadota bacterium]